MDNINMKEREFEMKFTLKYGDDKQESKFAEMLEVMVAVIVSLFKKWNKHNDIQVSFRNVKNG